MLALCFYELHTATLIEQLFGRIIHYVALMYANKVGSTFN